MSELTLIHEVLRKAARRRRLERGLRGMWRGFLAGSCVWLTSVVLYKVFPLPDAVGAWSWIAAIVGATLGLILGGWHRVTLPVAARVVESRQSLDQRLSTALEVSAKQDTTSWNQLVIGDAAAAIRKVDVRTLLPLGLPAFARWLPVLLAVMVGLGFVPEYRSSDYLKRKRDAEIIRDSGRKVAELVRRDLERREPTQEPVHEAIKAAGDLGERLSQARLTKADALQDLKNAAERLQDEARQLEKDPALRKLQESARTPMGGKGPSTGALQKQLEKMQQTAAGATPEAMQKLAEQLERAQKAASGMQGATPDAAAQQALSQSLSQLAQSAKDMGMSLSGLDQAMESLERLQIDRLLQDLKLAGNDLEKMRDLAKKLAEMQQQMEQVGKDLAEQLERGQAETAAETLEKMAQQIQGAGLTPEQLQKLTAEVSKALQPAGQYGKVGELLKQAAQGLSSGEKPGAAKSLASAAAELRKMAQQAQDMQQLADALGALEAAQVAIMNGRSWQQAGMCQGGACMGCALHPNGRLGAGRGGKPGRGVGTWAEENGWLFYPEISERWDNSGVNRPDMAARGQTDRGEGALSENLAPTKLRGQFSPGAMPSITLRGVSITGKSSVQYDQVVDAAQSDAQSALNQDQIPRAYRGAVKGYFDELK